MLIKVLIPLSFSSQIQFNPRHLCPHGAWGGVFARVVAG